MTLIKTIKITQDVGISGEAFKAADDGTILLQIGEMEYITARRKSLAFCPMVNVYPFISSKFTDSSRDPLPISKDEALDVIRGALEDLHQIVEAIGK